MYAYWLILVFFADPQAGARLPLLADCSNSAEVVASIDAATSIKIRYSMAGDSGACYAVTATVDGKPLNGFLLGSAHPTVAQFERDSRSLIPEIPPPPPPPPAPATAPSPDKKPAPAEQAGADASGPVSFAGFRAVDFDGRRIDLSASRAQNVVIYFWSPYGASSKKAESMEGLYTTYHDRGVDVVGVASGVSAAKLRDYCSQNEVTWPQVLDGGQLAARYHGDPAKPFLRLDRQRNVIAAASSPQGLGSALDQIAGRRRIAP